MSLAWFLIWTLCSYAQIERSFEGLFILANREQFRNYQIRSLMENHNLSYAEAVANLDSAKRKKKTPPRQQSDQHKSLNANVGTKKSAQPPSPKSRRRRRVSTLTALDEGSTTASFRLKGNAAKIDITRIMLQAKQISSRGLSNGWTVNDKETIEKFIDEVAPYRVGLSFDLADVALKILGDIKRKINIRLSPPHPRPTIVNPDRTRINEYQAASSSITWATKKRKR